MANGWRLERVVLQVLVSVVAVAMLYPVLWLLSSSLKPSYDIFTDPSLWVHHLTFANYVSGWKGIGGYTFARFFLNSTVVAGLSVAGNVLACSLTAYALARLHFPLRRLWFALVAMTMMLPFHVTLIPQYLIYHELGWINTILPLVVPHWLGGDAFFIIMLVQFMRGIPRELDESARIDGCGVWGIFAKIVFPLCVPAVITTMLFTFYWVWDDFFSQMIYLNDVSRFTVPLGLNSMVDQSGNSNWGGLFAMSVLSLLPVVVLFLACQRYFVEGIVTTGLK
ncbi:carbohydrate ABC transporter permease [Alicyclobacillus cellulosilyticus]|uniref:carbohydrate ABC transporter permease n=1 Tax=Alicyclobacillus cellulosilyticus TaxID=1003997 RepID=UPI001E3280C2|nr:carbohydrate ABC transporter permease [Alicyclobacillus cellulosilyticus]